MNPFIYSDSNKRYHTLSYYNKTEFGKSIYKASVDAGFTCPNIDGAKGKGGCIFCDGGSSRADSSLDIKKQIRSEMERIRLSHGEASEAIAYFQAHTNTYAPAERLKKLYNTALACDGICGLSIATRPDCLSDEIIALLKSYSERTTLTVELGLQTIHDTTAAYINRCYDFNVFAEAFDALKKRGIRTCVHIINGLPDESFDMMLETAEVLGRLRPDAVKIQLLHVLSGTRLEEEYTKRSFSVLSMDEYAEIVVGQLELLPPETVIERITGDGDRSKLIAPMWSKAKIAVISRIDRLQAEKNSFQGMRFNRQLCND